jgi:uncharacterized membrane protein
VTSLPLHPAIVHVPLGLAFVIPALAAGFAWALWTGRVRPRGAWVVVVALQAVLLGGGLVAMNTGEREEEQVERIVPDAALERHEEYAEQFVWAVGLTLVAATLVVAFRKPALVRAMAAATVIGSLVVVVAAVRVGHAGGQLVYQHNAGAAYATTGQQTVRSREAPDRQSSEEQSSRGVEFSGREKRHK